LGYSSKTQGEVVQFDKEGLQSGETVHCCRSYKGKRCNKTKSPLHGSGKGEEKEEKGKSRRDT